MTRKRIFAWVALAIIWFGGPLLIFENGWEALLAFNSLLIFAAIWIPLIICAVTGYWPWED